MTVFGKIQDKIDELIEGPTEFNPFAIDDAMASEVDWKPLNKGGTSFGTHRVKVVESARLEIRPTLMAHIFPMIFIAGGAISVATFLAAAGSYESIDFQKNWLWLLIGSVFSIVGIVLYFKLTEKKNFDLEAGYYWSGDKSPREVFDPNRGSGYVQLIEIHAIQLLKELVRDNDGSFKSYELNLILKDKTRINVIDHGGLQSIRKDAETIGKFLGVPVWDGIG